MNYNVVCVLLQPVAYTLRKTERNSASFSFVARSSAGALAGASRVGIRYIASSLRVIAVTLFMVLLVLARYKYLYPRP